MFLHVFTYITNTQKKIQNIFIISESSFYTQTHSKTTLFGTSISID